MQYFTPCAINFCLMLLSSAAEGVEAFVDAPLAAALRDFGKVNFFDFSFGAEFMGQKQSNCVQVVVVRSGRGARGPPGPPPSCEKGSRPSASSPGSENR